MLNLEIILYKFFFSIKLKYIVDFYIFKIIMVLILLRFMCVEDEFISDIIGFRIYVFRINIYKFINYVSWRS